MLTSSTFVACCIIVAGAAPTIAPRCFTEERTQEALGQPADMEALHAALAEARRRRQTGQSGHSELARRTAWQFMEAGHTLLAVRVLDEVVAQPETAFDLMSAHRMRGQYLKILGQRAEARQAFEQALAVVDQDPSLARYSLSYGSVVMQYAGLLNGERRHAEAAAVAERVIAAPPGTFDDLQVQSCFLEAVKALNRAGDSAAAVAKLDQLLQRYPERGRDEQAHELLAWRARLRDPSQSTDVYIAELQAIWDDPELGLRPEAVEIGRSIGDAYRRRGQLAAAVQQDVLTYIRATSMLADRNQGDPAVRLLEECRRSLLGEMASAHNAGRPDIAEFALQRFIELSPDPDERADLERQLQAIRDAAASPP